MRSNCLIGFIFFLTFQVTQAQSLKGSVSDSETGEPIPFANVFFSGTLIGTTSDLDGNFSLAVLNKGKYELVVSFVGYQTFSKLISTDSLPVLNIELQPEVVKLKDIQVDADTTGWANNYPVFKRLFVGETKNAAKVDISNPRDIFLFYDNVENGLFAHSKKVIQIENHALGYHLDYLMQGFAMEYRTKRFYSFGIPRFEEMTPKGKGQAKRWEKARTKTYNGSFSHFLRAFKQNTFSEEGFIVQELFRIPNPKRPPDSLIEKKLSDMKARTDGPVTIVIGGASDADSLAYWMSARNMPVLVDSLGKILKDNSLIQGQTLAYKGYLKITYTEEAEDPGYSQYRRGGGIADKQTSIVLFKDFLTIYDNGYYDIQKVFFEGYMGWSTKIADMLPLGYVPKSE